MSWGIFPSALLAVAFGLRMIRMRYGASVGSHQLCGALRQGSSSWVW
jgi:hypothetical protein